MDREKTVRKVYQANADILSISGIANRIGVSRSRLSKWLNGAKYEGEGKAKLSDAEFEKLAAILSPLNQKK